MPRAAQRVLIAALWALILTTSTHAQAEFLGDLRLSGSEASRFGGLSAIEVRDGGATALVLSDRGRLFDLTLTRTAGALTGATACCGAPITWEGGIHLPTSQRDSEGLAIMPDGTIAVSFEGLGPHTRIAFHGRDGVQIRALPRVPGAHVLPGNGTFEGVAADAQGRIYAVPESMPGQGPIPLIRWSNGAWALFAELPRAQGWSPVALDFDDRGRLYLLERRARLGFAARLTRFEVSASGLHGSERLLQTTTGRHGNLEGLSVWRDSTGRLIATMVSDDNFLPILEMALVEYVLPD